MKFVSALCLSALFLSPAVAAESPQPAKPPKAKPAESKPTDPQEIIAQAYKANKDNPAYFMTAAAYLWALSKKQTTSTKPARNGEAVLADPATGKPIGSIRMSDPTLQRKAIALLSEAHSKFPYRLDIGIALAFFQREMGEPEKSCETLIDILKYAPKNADKLEWKDGRPIPGAPQNFVPQLMQGNATEFRNLNTKEGYVLCRKLCEKTIQAYPNSPYGYSMLAGLYNALGDKKSTIKYLHLAHQKAPKDASLLLVLASTYQASGDTANARRYFEQVVTNAPSEEIKNAAVEALTKLRK